MKKDDQQMTPGQKYQADRERDRQHAHDQFMCAAMTGLLANPDLVQKTDVLCRSQNIKVFDYISALSHDYALAAMEVRKNK